MFYNRIMNILVARSEAEISHAAAILSRATTVGCDTETSSLSARGGRLFSVQFSDGDFNVLVPVSERIPLGGLASILADESIVKIFHNAKFDLDFLRANDVVVNNFFCTMIAEKLIVKGARQSASLAETLYRYFAVDLDKAPRGKFNRSWNGVWTDELVEYALSDVVHLPELYREQLLSLKRLGLHDEYIEKASQIEPRAF